MSRLFPFVLVTASCLLLDTTVIAAENAANLLPAKLSQTATQLRDGALKENQAYDIIASLTTEVGPRSAGSDGDRAAVAWALTKLKELDFSNVHAEPVTVPHWVRGEIAVNITAPWPQELEAIALGGSIGTAEDGIEAPVVMVETLDELKQLAPEQVRGKIVYIGKRMQRTHDGSGYGTAVAKRWAGAIEAAKLGAVAVLIRSVGTDNNPTPHTGSMGYDDKVKKIPAAALANPDADLLERELASGRTVTAHMKLTARRLSDEMSANVIGEIPGRTNEIVLLGAHLDSWDVGTGAHDDAAGVAIVTEAARLIGELDGKPRRTIRVVLFANEEFGLSGGRAYAVQHTDEIDRHVMVMEADLGAFKVWQFSSRVPEDKVPLAQAVAKLLEPLDVAWGDNHTHGGADIGPLMRQGVPAFGPLQDAEPYFDLHHTENDTLDKIDPAQLRQNVAVYATAAYIAANLEQDFGRVPVKSEEQ